MKVIVISLKRSVERRERIASQLEASGIEFSFLDAADAQQGNFPLSERRNDQLTKKKIWL
ncbi:hypothetical protein D4752_25805 [Vibrio parahaemolyticus]|nr:hypothetical protein D4752_25805 [Vibrio parahaemolyticus]